MTSKDCKTFFGVMSKVPVSAIKFNYCEDERMAPFAKKLYTMIYDLGFCTDSDPREWTDPLAVAYLRLIFVKIKFYFKFDTLKKGWLPETYYTCCSLFFRCIDLTIHNYPMLRQHNQSTSPKRLFLAHFVSKFMSLSDYQGTGFVKKTESCSSLSLNYLAETECNWPLSSSMPAQNKNSIQQSF